MKEYALPRKVQARADAALGALMRADQRAVIARSRFIALAFEIGLVRAESLLIRLNQRRRASKLVRPAVGRSSRRRR